MILHLIGTIVLGAATALTGQIFNLDEHWNTGLLLWTAGAGSATLILRHWTQGLLFALLAPLWLAFEWWHFVEQHGGASTTPALVFLFLIAIVYLARQRLRNAPTLVAALNWTGTVLVIPLGIAIASWRTNQRVAFTSSDAMGWLGAIVLPLCLARLLQASPVWTVAAAVWAMGSFTFAHGNFAVYVWSAIGATGLAVWGVRDKRAEQVNLGVIAFALTMFTFYFSSVMDKLGRSASLLSLGILLLGGGWALERLRRRLLVETRQEAS